MVGILTELGLCATAFALAFFVGWERHWSHRPAGLRTFPIVGLASCVFVLVGQSAFPDDPSSQARVIQGLMTGIGFIGGGAILKDVSDETGTVRGIANRGQHLGNRGHRSRRRLSALRPRDPTRPRQLSHPPLPAIRGRGGDGRGRVGAGGEG